MIFFNFTKIIRIETLVFLKAVYQWMVLQPVSRVNPKQIRNPKSQILNYYLNTGLTNDVTLGVMVLFSLILIAGYAETGLIFIINDDQKIIPYYHSCRIIGGNWRIQLRCITRIVFSVDLKIRDYDLGKQCK